MGKIDAMMQGRNEGLVLALKIVNKGGVKALEEEIKQRGLQGLSLNMPAAEINNMKKQITYRTVDVVSIISMLVLHDKFRFGRKRCETFRDHLISKTDALFDKKLGVTIEDYQQALKDEIGIETGISEGLGGRW